MEFLYFLQQLRSPVPDAIFSALTHLGEESVFLMLALLIFWCVDKQQGYYVLTVSFVGLSLNQFLKLLCRIPRPWVLDPNFPIVEEARAAATGYSFPSGHTQNAVNVFGSIARSTRRRSVQISCVVLILLVALSRMYLGVHTPLDVVTSLGIGTLLIFVLYPLLQAAQRRPAVMWALLACLCAIAVAFVLYVSFAAFPADIDPDNLASGQKNAWTILGCAFALCVVYAVDHYYLHFETAAPLAAQLCKLVLGIGITVLLKSGLKTPLLALVGGHPCATALRYFIIVVFAGAVWPMTFPFWTRLFKRKA